MLSSNPPLRPVTFHPDIPEIRFIIQTLLPEEFREDSAREVDRLAAAIRCLEIRGAPALGVAGAYGVALAALISPFIDFDLFLQDIR
ncbi:MAG: S-methyl-5-thioribose-1-phosphate isomerase, partial [Methanomicrobiales archaeon HGW-Methanomicrobiales-4]